MADSSGKTAIDTGGLTGIGLAISQALRANGHKVVIGTRRGGDADAQTMAKQEVGEDVHLFALDVRDPASVERFCEDTARVAGDVDILVNSAGVSTHQTI